MSDENAAALLRDELTGLLRRQSEDYRELSRDIHDIDKSVTRHEAILEDRKAVIERNEERHTKAESEIVELTRRANEHGRKLDRLVIEIDQMIQAQKAGDQNVNAAPLDWKTNPLVWSIVVTGAVALVALWFAFGGDPKDLADKVPQLK